MRDKKPSVLKFDAIKIPQPIESYEKTNERPVNWGLDNNYPAYLLKLYAESAIHSSIVNSKSNYIIGDGLKYATGEAIKAKVNAADTFDEFVSKIVKEYLIFNCFAVEVIYNSFNQPIEYHFVPVHKVRTNKDKTKFWVNQDWRYEKPIIFQRWKPVSENTVSKIFFFDGYCPSVNSVYPQADYHGCIPSIVLESEIKKFNLNNIQNHFSVSTLITFFNGVSNDEVKKDILNSIKQSYTGAEGKKIMLDFQQANGKGADVQNLSPGDWDKAYDLIAKAVKQDIIQGHQITTPALFGVMAEGQLGASTEMEVGYEIFKTTYIRTKRNELLTAFNTLFANSELIKGTLDFGDIQLFANRLSDTMKEKVYTVNEIRQEVGLKPLPNGERMIGDTSSTQTFKAQESQAISLSEEDFEKVKDMGSMLDEFEILFEGGGINSKEDFSRVQLAFETWEEISEYITENDISGMDLKELKKNIRKDLGINITTDELNEAIDKLNKAGIAKVSIVDDKIKVEKPNESSRKIEVMYSYNIRPNYGQSLIETTRAFCRKLIENNRLYTRQEVQTMAAIFGYDVFQYGGGFYRNPETGTITSHCRHYFKSVTVSRKRK